ncbi:MAG: beta-ketoacyl-[acyl-carrier-protein] synthase family protein [Desulfobacterales bacterium]
MKANRVFITGMGAITPAGSGVSALREFLKSGTSFIGDLHLFPVSQENRFPVGEIQADLESDTIPRTHQLALSAAREALKHAANPPDALVLGVTTGGMLTTETLLKQGISDPAAFRFHATGSVAEYLEEELGCKGPVLTVSTACSSGAAAIKTAAEMLRAGQAKQILAGGADCLCRLTCYGFKSLQLIDPKGAKPWDQQRRGMSVAEASALVLLEAGEESPDNALAEILGAGLSCDAYHPSSPHPDGDGALAAMTAAIRDAEISLSDVDYISLHGTGTPDNDLSEAKALVRLFGEHPPRFSSVKGALGHSLAASGAVEAVISVLCTQLGQIPANTGCTLPDPALKTVPALQPVKAEVETVLSNSFGFGGNNAVLVLGTVRKKRTVSEKKHLPLRILGQSCITGAGRLGESLEKLLAGENCKGILSPADLSQNLSPGAVRRMKRLPRMVLSLAISAFEQSGCPEKPDAVYMGTGWGPLSETHDFLTRLFASDEKFTSPTDFIGSVHNAPAGHAAMHFGARGPNITVTGGDSSFEQALMAADLLAGNRENPFLLLAADEFHSALSPLFDPSVLESEYSDGGGAFCVKKSEKAEGICISPLFFENGEGNPEIISSLIRKLETQQNDFAAIMAGIPAAFREKGEDQLQEFVSLAKWNCPVADYRKWTGEFASASAVAAVLSSAFVRAGEIPAALCMGTPCDLKGKGILLLGLGKFVTAVGITP